MNNSIIAHEVDGLKGRVLVDGFRYPSFCTETVCGMFTLPHRPAPTSECTLSSSDICAACVHNRCGGLQTPEADDRSLLPHTFPRRPLHRVVRNIRWPCQYPLHIHHRSSGHFPTRCQTRPCSQLRIRREGECVWGICDVLGCQPLSWGRAPPVRASVRHTALTHRYCPPDCPTRSQCVVRS